MTFPLLTVFSLHQNVLLAKTKKPDANALGFLLSNNRGFFT